MIIGEIGNVTENVYMIGHPGMPAYLVDGDRPTIIDTGFSFMAEPYAADIRRILGRREPALCLLTHVHFDHCGATSGLKKRFPRMQVAASAISSAILAKPAAIERIRQLNRAAEQMAGDLGIRLPESNGFEPFTVDLPLNDGDRLTLSDGLTLHVLESPGHTRDTLSYYLPESRVLFASEAAGVPDTTGYIVIDCLLDFDQYVHSLERLCQLEIEAVCLAHRFAYTGEDARRYMQRAVEHCALFFQTVERFLREENGDIDRVIQRVRAFEYDPKPQPKQPEPAYMLNLEARVKAVVRKLGSDDNQEPRP